MESQQPWNQEQQWQQAQAQPQYPTQVEPLTQTQAPTQAPPSPQSSIRSWPTSAYSLPEPITSPSARTSTTQWPRLQPSQSQSQSPEAEQEPLLTRQTTGSSTLTSSSLLKPLRYHQTPGEKDWERLMQSRSIPGQRSAPLPPRGVLSGPGRGMTSEEIEEKVCDAVEACIVYHFHNRDLLLEALESPGSGVVVVGEGNRVVANGNKELSKLGQAVMELALQEQFYEKKIAESEHMRLMSQLGRHNLARVGEKGNIQKWIRPRMPLAPSRQRNIFHLLKDDIRSEDSSRTIARAIRALIGAVYLDGGKQAAEKVMMELRLLIR